jgi:hypothetical protein
MVEDEDRLGAWYGAAICVEQTGDPRHFTHLFRLVGAINRRERWLIAQALEGWTRPRIDHAVSDLHHGRLGTSVPPAVWKPIGGALMKGDIKPLLEELRSEREFGQDDLDALGRLFWRLRLKKKGRPRAKLVLSPEETRVRLAAQHVKRLQTERILIDWNGRKIHLPALSRQQAIEATIAGALTNSGEPLDETTLTNYLDVRRGSTQRRRHRG